MGEDGEERPADFDQIVETTGLDPEQVGLKQCGPLSLVETQRGSALIGRELHSVATPVSLMP